jgi:exopolysaccharide biosynthesis polyprenyl glycosylphosphotransferase
MWAKNHMLRVLTDTVSVASAYLLAFMALYGTFPNGMKWYGLFLMLLIYFLSAVIPVKRTSPEEESTAETFAGAWRQTVYMAFLLAVFLFFFARNNYETKIFFVLQIGFLLLCLNLGRIYCKAVILNYYDKDKNKIRLLIFANKTNALTAMRRLAASKLCRYDLIALAIVDGETEQVELNLIQYRDGRSYMVTESADIDEYMKRQAIDEALLSLPNSSREYISSLLKTLQSMGIVAHVAANSLGLSEEAKQVGELGNYRVLTYGTRIFTPAELFIKRMMDICGALTGLLLTGILSIFVVPAICLESPGPAIFKQIRVGKNGRKFAIYKFRSMYIDAEERKRELMEKNEMNGLMFKIKDDPRITRTGRFIRKTSIDEFPQFLNVLKGDMSLVGTRPPTVDEFEQYEEHHKRRLSLKPGITGMWQVSGRSDIQDFEDVVRMDLEYIDNWSVWLDIKILIQTVFVVFSHKGAS